MMKPSSCTLAALGLVAVLSLWQEYVVAASLPMRTRPLRLPNDTYPLSYHLHINSSIHLGIFQFSGNATIDIEIRQSTNEIVLHAKNLNNFQIIVLQLNEAGFETVDDLTHTYDQNASFLVIHPRENYQAFEAGQRYRVQILYSSEMGTKAVGLYWMTYREELSNQTVYVAATQSEPTYARLFFPCYDEPAIKSNFSIRLTHSSKLMSISNMPVKHLLTHGELSTTVFETTPPMSTYLVAFVISDFDHISMTYRGITQSIYSSPNTKRKCQDALQNVVRTLASIEDYFGVNYSLPKLDHVALNKNYGSAMENWGLITFKEDNLLTQDTVDVQKRMKDIIVQTHEIVHQWFGNLVSPEWWTYAWLNEGFASYYSYVIADQLYPEDNYMDVFLAEEADRAYSFNNFFDVRPMTYYVEKESDIMKGFGVVTYQRAACVVRMFHHAFHRPTFQRGITRYLEKYKYSVANELDLFDALQESLLEDELFQQQSWVHRVREIMLSWTHSEWLPILLVTRNYENNTITFSQRSLHSKSEHWWIPLNFASLQEPSFEQTHAVYFIPPLAQHTVSLEELKLQLSGRDWLIVNKQQTGFFHVHYDADNLRAIARQLQQNHSIIHPVNRAALFRDLTPMMEHNEIESVEVLFEMLKYLEFEEDLGPWDKGFNAICFLQRNLFGTDSYSLFKQFVRRLVAPTFQRLFQKPEAGQITINVLEAGHNILEVACNADLPECLEFTHKLGNEYIFKNNDSVMDSVVMYDTVLCLSKRYLSDEELKAVIGMLQITDRNSSSYDDLYYSLRCTQSHSHLMIYLDFLLGDNSTHLIPTNSESMMYLFYLYKYNMEARPVIWQYIDRNYKRLCRLPTFVEHFNEIAEYLPRHQRPFFVTLREKIFRHLELENLDIKDNLIEIDSRLVGKKMQSSELFLEKFEQDIHKWLLNELPKADSKSAPLYAASVSVGNGSSRPENIWHAASRMVKRAFHSNLSLV